LGSGKLLSLGMLGASHQLNYLYVAGHLQHMQPHHLGWMALPLTHMIWKQEILYCHCFSTSLYNVPSGKYKKMGKGWNWMEPISSWSVLTMLIYWVKT